MKFIGQLFAYLLFVALVGSLSAQPRLRLLGDDMAMISISFTHAGRRVAACRRLTREQLNELPPNMRTPDDCPRGRHPLYVELRAGEKAIFARELPPSGLWSDGKSIAYERIRMPAGRYQLSAALSETGDRKTFDHTSTQSIVLAPGQNLVIGFDEERGEFFFH